MHAIFRFALVTTAVFALLAGVAPATAAAESVSPSGEAPSSAVAAITSSAPQRSQREGGVVARAAATGARSVAPASQSEAALL